MQTALRSPRPEDAAQRRGGRAAELLAVLQEEVESGLLPPGTPLDERALAARFEVSRTPVREALQQLAARGLVLIAPRQGVTVTRLSIARVRAMLEFIAELEALCAKFAARRIDAALSQALDAALARCATAAAAADPLGAAEDYVVANDHFHDTIYAGARNAYLAQQICQARRMIRRYRRGNLHGKAQQARSLADHRVIAAAIQAGDEARAASAMLAHLAAGSTAFSEFLAMIPAEYFDADFFDAASGAAR